MSKATSLSPEEISPDDMVIAFMGPTGTGKSTFIDLLTGQEGKRAGKNLESVTHHVEATCVLHPQSGGRIVLVDTPGFDDTYMTELQVLKLIANWLQKTYTLNIKLFGIVYLHPISDRRIRGSTLKNLRMFERLCGELAMASVVLTTTMWKDVDLVDAEERETQLTSKFWKPLIEIGATVDRLKATDYAEAWRVVDGLIEKRSESNREAIWLQVELVDLKRKLNQTDAGKELYSSLQTVLDQVQKQRKSLRAAKKMEDDPTVTQELEAELKEIEARLAQVKADAAKLKISFGGRLQKLFNFLDFRSDSPARAPTNRTSQPPDHARTSTVIEPNVSSDCSLNETNRTLDAPQKRPTSLRVGPTKCDTETPNHPSTGTGSSNENPDAASSSDSAEVTATSLAVPPQQKIPVSPSRGRPSRLGRSVSRRVVPRPVSVLKTVSSSSARNVPRPPDLQQLVGVLMKDLDHLVTEAANLVEKIGHDDVQVLTNFLDLVLDQETYKATDRQKRILNLQSQIAVHSRVFPQRCTLRPIEYDANSVGEGGSGDVHQACNQTVRVKVLRRTDEEVLRSYAKELSLWSRLSHSTIVPFFGTYLSDPNRRMCLVSPWMSNGNLNDYTSNLSQNDRLPLLRDVVDGLAYLHGLGIVHTNLKGQNVLVSNEGRALLTDLGVLPMPLKQRTPGVTYAAHYVAPEVLLFEAARAQPSKAYDIWSFGCLCYEILSRKLPFHDCDTSQIVHALCVKQKLPERPRSDIIGWEPIDDTVWSLIISCWKFNPRLRPDCRGVLNMMKRWTILSIPDVRLAANPLEVPQGIETVLKSKVDLIHVDRVFRKFQEVNQTED